MINGSVSSTMTSLGTSVSGVGVAIMGDAMFVGGGEASQ